MAGFASSKVIWRPQAVLGPVAKAFAPAVLSVTRVAIQNAPVRDGTLRRSIKPVIGIMHGAISATARHAAAVEEGSRPHTIAPIRKTALANKKMGFGPVKGPVEHPGTQGRGFIHAAAAQFPVHYATQLRMRLPKR